MDAPAESPPNSQFSILNSRTGWQPVLLESPLVERAARAFGESPPGRAASPLAAAESPPVVGRGLRPRRNAK